MAVKLYTPDDNVIVHQAKVDFRRRIVQRQVNLVQYDKSMPIIAVQLYSNGNEYVLPENANAYIRFGKRDHTYVYNECLGCDQTRTIVYFAITDQMTIFYGEHTPIVELRIGDTVAGSGSIPIWIDRNPIQNGDTESKSDLSVFEKAIEAAQKINVKLPTDLKATATNLSLLAGATKIGNGINLSGFEYDEETKTLKASGGGASVSPCLNLLDMTARPATIRTSITEEEKNNLEKGLYNSVLYFDASAGPFGVASMSLPEPLTTQVMPNPNFSIFNVTVDEATHKATITGSSIYEIVISDKNADGNYPISIRKMDEATFVGGGGGGARVSTCLNLMDPDMQNVRTSITEEEKNNIEKGLYSSVFYFDPSSVIDEVSSSFPEIATTINGYFSFSKYNLSFDETTQKITILSSSIYDLNISTEKSEDGTYPITIEKISELDSSFGGGGGGAIQEIEAIKSTGGRSRDNQYTLSSTPTSSMFIMKVKNYDGVYSRFTMILQSLNKSNQAYFGFKVDSLSPDSNTCVYAYSEGTTAILSNQCYLPPEIKSGDLGKVLVARDYGYNLEDLPSSLPNISQSDIGKYLVVGNNQEASWQNLPESTSTIIRRW